MESAAQAHGLPFEFFARLIWQESRFQPNAVGPMTRNGQRAQGIAQFMPGTASERGLFDPFDPVSALPKAAEFLEELHRTFGNLGLAAAAYNAGPRRVRDWLDGHGGLPAETRNYVLRITGRSAEEWAAASRSGDGDKGPLREGQLPRADGAPAHRAVAVRHRAGEAGGPGQLRARGAWNSAPASRVSVCSRCTPTSRRPTVRCSRSAIS